LFFPFSYAVKNLYKFVICDNLLLKGGAVMDKNEIALKIVLAMIERGAFITTGCDSNESYGKSIAEMYNAVLKTMQD
jgi:hypothetical protein